MKTSGRSPIVLFLGTTVILGGLIGYSYTVGKDSAIGSTTITVVERIKGAATEKLTFLEKLKLPGGAEKQSSIDTSDQPPVLKECLDAVFLEKRGFHFSQSRWGAAPVPYQFRGLELIGPKDMALNGADRMTKIERRILYTLETEAFRIYDEEKEWGPWQFDAPPNMSPIILVQQDGVWKIAASPKNSYSPR